MNYSEFFKLGKEKNFKNIQITELTSEDINVEYIDDKLENNNFSSNITYLIKAEKNNKTVKMSSDYLEENILNLLEEKIKYTDSYYTDEYLTDKNQNNISNFKSIDIKEEIEVVKKIYKEKEKFKFLKIITSYLSASAEKTRIINSNGVDISTASVTYSYDCELVLENNNETISYSKSILKTKKDELNIKALVEEAINEAKKMTIKENLKTDKYNIVLSNEVAGSIISKIITGIYANNIREKTSIFENKLNKLVFGKNINIVENPLDIRYPGYTMFDNEGTKVKNKDIIKNGVLKTYLYDIKEAKIVNKESTGNSFGRINTRNLYLVPENNSKEKILKQLKTGIYITDFMGSQGTSIDINTGKISLQIFGFIVEDGKIKCGFEPCVLTTTITEMFNNVKLIGNDLEFYEKSVGSPSILINNISIAAK